MRNKKGLNIGESYLTVMIWSRDESGYPSFVKNPVHTSNSSPSFCPKFDETCEFNTIDEAEDYLNKWSESLNIHAAKNSLQEFSVNKLSVETRIRLHPANIEGYPIGNIANK